MQNHLYLFLRADSEFRLLFFSQQLFKLQEKWLRRQKFYSSENNKEDHKPGRTDEKIRLEKKWRILGTYC